MATVPSLLTNPLNLRDSQSFFRPWYTPKEMLQLGVYGGIFFFYEGNRQGVPPELFTGLDEAKWKSPEYLSSNNYFNVTLRMRNRGIEGMASKERQKHPAWFKWYTQFYYGLEFQGYVNSWRMLQWKEEILTIYFYIEQGTYTPPDPNPNNYTRYTDPAWQPEWKQHLVQYGWDPTRRPGDFGIR